MRADGEADESREEMGKAGVVLGGVFAKLEQVDEFAMCFG